MRGIVGEWRATKKKDKVIRASGRSNEHVAVDDVERCFKIRASNPTAIRRSLGKPKI